MPGCITCAIPALHISSGDYRNRCERISKMPTGGETWEEWLAERERELEEIDYDEFDEDYESFDYDFDDMEY
jgi:hypothetical protein